MKRITIALLLVALAATPVVAQDRDRLDELAARSGAFVQAVKNDVVMRGVIPTPQRDNCDSFQITARVAWRLRAQGAKLIPKAAGQNGCTWLGVRYSHDAIALPDGWADLLVGAGPPLNQNQPAWQFTATGPSAGALAPIDLDAVLAPPVVTPPPVDPPLPQLPPQILTELIAKLLMEVQALRQDVAAMKAEQARGLSGQLFGYPITLKP